MPGTAPETETSWGLKASLPCCFCRDFATQNTGIKPLENKPLKICGCAESSRKDDGVAVTVVPYGVQEVVSLEARGDRKGNFWTS